MPTHKPYWRDWSLANATNDEYLDSMIPAKMAVRLNCEISPADLSGSDIGRIIGNGSTMLCIYALMNVRLSIYF